VNSDPRLVADERRPSVSPWRLGGLSAATLARRVYDGLWAHDLFDRAASLSYYFLFALFPALLFLTAILGLVPGPKLMDHLLDYVARVLPADAASLLSKTLGEAVKGARGSLVSLGVLGALWGASSGMVSISHALNVAFEVRDTRTWWRHRLEAIGLTVWFSGLTIVALLLFVFGERIGEAGARRRRGLHAELERRALASADALRAGRHHARLPARAGGAPALAADHARRDLRPDGLAGGVVRPAAVRHLPRQLQRHVRLDRRGHLTDAVVLSLEPGAAGGRRDQLADPAG
jgi:hypothetical protein